MLKKKGRHEYVYGIVITGEGEKTTLVVFFALSTQCSELTHFKIFLATDWYFILHSTKGIYSTSRTEYRISLTEDALGDSTEIRKSVKRILEVKDKASVSDEPASKKHYMEEKINKK